MVKISCNIISFEFYIPQNGTSSRYAHHLHSSLQSIYDVFDANWKNKNY